MKCIVAATLLAAFSAPVAAASGTEATATKLVAEMRIEGILDKMFTQITPLVVESVVGSISQSTVPGIIPIKAKLADPVMAPQVKTILSEEILKAFKSSYPQLLAASAHEYAAKFSEEDLQAALAFYQSPTGQRMIAAQPELQTKLSEEGRQIGLKIAPAAFSAAEKRITALR